MNIRPLHDRVVVRRLEEETTTSGGILVPTLRRKNHRRVTCSPLDPARSWKTAISGHATSKRETRSLFGQYGGSKVKIDDEELLILSESEIFGVLEG